MDQLICASLSHTHYWYELGMLKFWFDLLNCCKMDDGFIPFD